MKKNFQKKYLFAVSVAIVGSVLGLVIQFASAWTVPPKDRSPVEANIGAPITTGSAPQTRKGTLSFQGYSSNGLPLNGWIGMPGDHCACDSYLNNGDVDNAFECVGRSNEEISNNWETDKEGKVCYDWGKFAGFPISMKYTVSTLSKTDSNSMLTGSVATGSVAFSDNSTQTTGIQPSVDDSLCVPLTFNGATECAKGYYLRSPTKCCPFSSTISSLNSKWINIDAVTIADSVGSYVLGSVHKKSFISAKNITAIRISNGVAAEAGYCYAYWNRGEVHANTGGENAASGFYTADGVAYPRVVENPAGCPSPGILGGYTWKDSSCTPTDTTTCAPDAYVPTCTYNCPSYSFDYLGNAKLCVGGDMSVSNFSATQTPQNTKIVNIPSGTTISLQGQGINLNESNNTRGIWCNLEVQYGN